MQLPDGPRQILAGVLAAAAFLGFYFGLSMVWWGAFVLALVVFGAVLLMVPRRPNADEVVLSGTTTEADIQAAGKLMDAAAKRLETAGEVLPGPDQKTVETLTGYVRSIRDHVLNDPEDYRRARRFINSYLGTMVNTVERYADLTRKAKGRHEDRLAPMSQQIESFVPALQKIDAACLENDFIALESQVEALAVQMKRG